MQKRQRILLGLMGLTIAVALAMQATGPSVPEKPAPGSAGSPGLPGLPGTPDNLQQLLEQVRASTGDLYKLGLMADNSTQNPFYEGRGVIAMEEDGGLGAPGEAEFVYSGYIQAGKKAFAVIDGIEYAKGDQLADSVYKVDSIEKDAVVLERTDGTTGRKLTRRIPLVEDVTDTIRIRVVKRR